jgi:hypothetical protein
MRHARCPLSERPSASTTPAWLEQSPLRAYFSVYVCAAISLKRCVQSWPRRDAVARVRCRSCLIDGEAVVCAYPPEPLTPLSDQVGYTKSNTTVSA